MRLLVIAALALAACKQKQAPPSPAPEPAKPAPPAPPPIDRAALLDGKLPEGAPDVLAGQCQICHSLQYLTQQRLTEPAWTKTIAKMRKFGANLTDEQAAALAKFAATYWNPDLPGRTWKLGPLPPGALPP